MLDRINNDLIKATKVQQWKNTADTINWFKSIDKNCIFLSFDVEFYPSIKSNHLDEAIEFASKHTQLGDRDKEIIMHSKKSLFFHENHPWQKSQQTDNFDVSMGSFDGAETCELIGTYILNKTQNVINNNDIGLYRDDG